MHPHPSSDGLSQRIMRLFVATAIPVFGLFVLRIILSSLPMIKNAGPIADIGVTPLILVKAALDTVMYFLIIRFCLGESQQLKSLRPDLAEIGTVVILTGAALVATLAYSGYEGLMQSLAPTQMEVYNWLFLAMVLAPIGIIVMMVTRRLDFFSNLVFGKLSEAVAQPAAFAAPASHQVGYPPYQGASAPTPMPPSGPPPGQADPAQQREQQLMKERIQSLQKKTDQAAAAAQTLRAQGKLTPELVESAAKVQQYLNGASQSLGTRDLAAAKGFADWAEYEASRILQAAR